MRKTIIVLIVLDFLALIGFFVTYGPWSYLRDLLVTTAMNTMNHTYLARIFYSDEMIAKVMSKNYIVEVNEETNTNEIQVGNISEEAKYASAYEKQILERDKDALYKLIEFKYNGYDAYLTAIYDPSRVELAPSRYLGTVGEKLTEIATYTGAKVAINASGFPDTGGEGNGSTPTGVYIKDGKIKWTGSYGQGNIVGFSEDDVLILTKDTPQAAIQKGMRDGMQFGPFLIVNGKPAEVGGNGGAGMNPRTAIAQRKDGIVLFLVIDGNGVNKYNWDLRGGATYGDLITILQRYGAYNAANMDGGASTTFVYEGNLYNKPCGYGGDGQRRLPNAWIVK